MKLILFLLLAAPAMPQQQPDAVLRRPDAQKAYQKIVDLMESSSIAVPELGRATQPLVANARQDAKFLQSGGFDNSAVLYRFLSYARVYLELSEALPKPYPFAEDARKQLLELRETRDRLEAHFRALLENKERQLRNPDRDNLARYAEANKMLAPPPESENRVVFLGDSITDGWRLNEYFPGKPYVNRGISGQITGQMLGRMMADVIELKPSAVLVLAGTNDIARGIPPAAIQNNLLMIADLAAAYRIKPIFASILPIHDYHKDKDPSYLRSTARPPQTILALNRWIQTLCKQRGYAYVDYFSAMVDAQGFLKAELADDGLHPNAAGYRVMGPIAQAAIDKTLAPAPPPRRRR